MALRSLLMIRLAPGRRQEAVAAYVQRRALEECAEAIEGFLEAELLLAADEPELVCIAARWRDAAAYQAWLASPVRAAQWRDLSAFASADDPPRTVLLDRVHGCVRGGPDGAA